MPCHAMPHLASSATTALFQAASPSFACMATLSRCSGPRLVSRRVGSDVPQPSEGARFVGDGCGALDITCPLPFLSLVHASFAIFALPACKVSAHPDDGGAWGGGGAWAASTPSLHQHEKIRTRATPLRINGWHLRPHRPALTRVTEAPPPRIDARPPRPQGSAMTRGNSGHAAPRCQWQLRPRRSIDARPPRPRRSALTRRH